VIARFFDSNEGPRLLADALKKQNIIQGNADIAQAMSGAVSLVAHTANQILVKEGDSDNNLLLIVSGSVRIEIGGREIARRQAGEHTGEMALIDVTAKRSASVIANEDCVVAVVSESDFEKLADRFPVLWRRLAIELAERLRQSRADRV